MKIAILCHFSNPRVRERLELMDLSNNNILRQLFGFSAQAYGDGAPWISEYINEFEKHREYEFHFIAPHMGMKNAEQEFEDEGIHYHFFRSSRSNIYKLLDRAFKIDQRSNYAINRKYIRSFIKRINPDIVVLFGAENAYYSLGALDIYEHPVLLQMQTVLNNPQLVSFGVGTEYMRQVERKIFKQLKYFGCPGRLYYDLLKQINPNAVVFKEFFPIHRPPQLEKVDAEFDFVFYASGITKNKGSEDVIRALGKVAKTHPDTQLCMIGSCRDDYKAYLDHLISELGITENVFFTGRFPNHDDVFRQINKAKFVVVPGITAIINSTVIEPMFLSKPVITYATTGTPYLNRNKPCVLLAKNGNVEDLAAKMEYALTHSDEMAGMAENGFKQVEEEFSSKMSANRLLSILKSVKDFYSEGTPLQEDLLFHESEFPHYDIV